MTRDQGPYPLRGASASSSLKTKDGTNDPTEHSRRGRRGTNAQAALQQPQGQRLRRSLGGGWFGGAEADRGAPIRPLALDLNIPGPNGLQVLEAVRRTEELAVVVLSGRGREVDKVEALNRGADDYLCKPFGIAELMARVKALLRRVAPGTKASLPVYQYEGREVDFAARRARLHGSDVRLTRREFEVLAYFARNAGKILLHRQVLQAIWGGEYGEEADYVWTFAQRIRRKIEPDRTQPRYLLTEPGVGYHMPPSQKTDRQLNGLVRVVSRDPTPPRQVASQGRPR